MPGRGVVRMPLAVLHCRDTKRHQLGCHLPGGHAERAIISQFCHADVALAAIGRREINLLYIARPLPLPLPIVVVYSTAPFGTCRNPDYCNGRPWCCRRASRPLCQHVERFRAPCAPDPIYAKSNNQSALPAPVILRMRAWT
jgi:hypothetical protein